MKKIISGILTLSLAIILFANMEQRCQSRNRTSCKRLKSIINHMWIVKVLRPQKCSRGFLYPCLKFKRLQYLRYRAAFFHIFRDIFYLYASNLCKKNKSADIKVVLKWQKSNWEYWFSTARGSYILQPRQSYTVIRTVLMPFKIRL